MLKGNRSSWSRQEHSMSENVALKGALSLRNNAHQVQLILPNGANNPVLGTSDPEAEQRRINIVKQWGGYQHATRQQGLLGIEQPLAQRTQSILYYQLPAAQRQRVNGGLGLLGSPRKQYQDVTDVTLLPSAE